MAGELGEYKLTFKAELQQFKQGLKEAQQNFSTMAASFIQQGKLLEGASQASLMASAKQLDFANASASRFVQQALLGASGLRQIAGSVQGFATKFALLGVAMQVPIVLASKLGAEFEQNIDILRSIFDKTGSSALDFEKKFISLTETIRELGRTTNFTSVEVSTAATELARAGFGVSQVQALLQPTLELANVGGLTLARSAEVMSNAINVFGLAAIEGSRVTDVFAKSQASANTTVEEMASALSFAGPVTAAFGQSLEQTVAVLNVLANQGIKAGRAGTGLAQILSRLTKDVEKTEEFAQKLGLSFEELNPEANTLSDIILKLRGRTVSTGDAMQFFGERAGRAFLALRNAPIDTIIEQVSKMENSFGEAASQSEQRFDNVVGAVKRLRSAVQEFGIQVFESIAVPLRRGIDHLTSAMTAVIEFFKNNEMLGQVVLVTAALSTFLIVLGTPIAMFAALIGAMAGLRAAFLSLDLGLTTSIASLKALGINTQLSIEMSLAAAAANLKEAATIDAKTAANKRASLMIGSLSSKGGVTSMSARAGVAELAAPAKVGGAVPAVLPAVLPGGKDPTLKGLIGSSFKETLLTPFVFLKKLISGAFSSIGKFAISILKVVTSIDRLVNALFSLAKGAAWIGLLVIAGEALFKNFDKIWTLIVALGGVVVSFFKGIFDGFKQALASVDEAINAVFGEDNTWMGDGAKGNPLTEFVGVLIDLLTGLVQAIGWVLDKIGLFVGAFIGLVIAALDAILRPFKVVFDWFADLGKGILESFGFVKSVADQAADSVASFNGDMEKFFKNLESQQFMAKKVASGIRELVGAMKTAEEAGGIENLTLLQLQRLQDLKFLTKEMSAESLRAKRQELELQKEQIREAIKLMETQGDREELIERANSELRIVIAEQEFYDSLLEDEVALRKLIAKIKETDVQDAIDNNVAQAALNKALEEETAIREALAEQRIDDAEFLASLEEKSQFDTLNALAERKAAELASHEQREELAKKDIQRQEQTIDDQIKNIRALAEARNKEFAGLTVASPPLDPAVQAQLRADALKKAMRDVQDRWKSGEITKLEGIDLQNKLREDSTKPLPEINPEETFKARMDNALEFLKGQDRTIDTMTQKLKEDQEKLLASRTALGAAPEENAALQAKFIEAEEKLRADIDLDRLRNLRDGEIELAELHEDKVRVAELQREKFRDEEFEKLHKEFEVRGEFGTREHNQRKEQIEEIADLRFRKALDAVQKEAIKKQQDIEKDKKAQEKEEKDEAKKQQEKAENKLLQIELAAADALAKQVRSVRDLILLHQALELLRNRAEARARESTAKALRMQETLGRLEKQRMLAEIAGDSVKIEKIDAAINKQKAKLSFQKAAAGVDLIKAGVTPEAGAMFENLFGQGGFGPDFGSNMAAIKINTDHIVQMMHATLNAVQIPIPDFDNAGIAALGGVNPSAAGSADVVSSSFTGTGGGGVTHITNNNSLNLGIEAAVDVDEVIAATEKAFTKAGFKSLNA